MESNEVAFKVSARFIEWYKLSGRLADAAFSVFGYGIMLIVGQALLGFGAAFEGRNPNGFYFVFCSLIWSGLIVYATSYGLRAASGLLESSLNNSISTSCVLSEAQKIDLLAKIYRDPPEPELKV